MTPSTILVVEDNPITRKMRRLVLEGEGHEVLEFGEGAAALKAACERVPDLLVIDYLLPDTDGLTLLAEIRLQTGKPALPALIVTGMGSRVEELGARGGPQVQVLLKPVPPSRLLELVRAHLTLPGKRDRQRRVLIVDDEPMNLKLAALRLQLAGYEVQTARGGAEAIVKGCNDLPDVILADVLMPSMDGFTFCIEARRNPRLAAVPIVLISAAYVEGADQELARQAGANALVVRTADFEQVIEALEKSVEAAATSQPMQLHSAMLAALHHERLQVQLERQTARNDALVRQAAIQATALSVVRGLSEILAQPHEVPKVLSNVLVHCLDATGLSTGLLYIISPTGTYRLQAQFGIVSSDKSDAEASFGHPELLRRIASAGKPVAFARDALIGDPELRDLIARLHQPAVLMVPFEVGGKGFGLLVLASDTHDLTEDTWLTFGRSIASQFTQTAALGQSLTRLAASESRYRAVMEQANDAILILGGDGRVIEANAQAERLLDTPRAKLVGEHPEALAVPQERSAAARFWRKLRFKGAARVESHRFQRADGTPVAVEISAASVQLELGGGEPMALAILRDLTERRRAEEALRESEEQYRLLFDGHPHPMWVLDDETEVFLAVNAAAIRHYGYSREEFLSSNAGDLAADVASSPGPKPHARAPLGPATPSGLVTHRKKDGAVIQVEIAESPIHFLKRDARLVLALDVTEKRSLEAQLLQSQKMESVGQLAGGVAHDFNNLLGVITGYGEMLRKRMPDDPNLLIYVDDILKAATRAASLTRQLLAFSRRQLRQPRILDLNAVVEDMEKMLERLIGEHIEMITDLDPNLPAVLADAGQIEQVLMNLVVNARDAMSEGGRLIIETGTAHFDERYVANNADVGQGSYAMLAVRDTGHGMTAEVRGHLFEPFFTTKEEGKGTGLGLATVHGIVKQSGGHIFVYSEPGNGSAFKVYLPSIGSTGEPRDEAPEQEVPRGTETILVVEDEVTLRLIVVEHLRGSGYTVLNAAHGLAALQLAAGHPGPIDLLMTDVVMPGIGGGELARRLTELRPETRVLYISGYTDDAKVVRDVLTGSTPFLEKPFTAAALAHKVREVLDAPHAAEATVASLWAGGLKE